MAFSSLRSRLPSQSSFFSTLSGLPSAASAGWSHTIRGGLSSLDELRSDGVDDEDDRQRADDILQRLIWQAGSDDEGRPIVCIAASLLPEPQTVAYDTLLARIIETLQDWVQQDYVLVFFAAGGKHYPPFTWFWSAWGRLGRAFRKNLKKLYLVHSTFFTKMLFTMAAPLVSPKFYRKIAYLRTLSDLAAVVPMHQILVPPEAFRENLLLEQSITLPSPVPARTFKLPLSSLMPPQAPDVLPPLIRQSSAYLRRSSRLSAEGLFRKSPSRGVLRCLEEAYDRGSPVDLELYDDPHLAAVLIKTLFRELETPLFGSAAYPIIRTCPRKGPNGEGANEMIAYIEHKVLSLLSPAAHRLLGHVIYLLHDVSLEAATNLMTSTNLAIVFTPNLVRSSNPQADALLFLVPNPARPRHPDSPAMQPSRPTTLGEIIQFLIDHPAVFPVEHRETGDQTTADQSEAASTEHPSARKERAKSDRVISGDFFAPPDAASDVSEAAALVAGKEPSGRKG